MTAHGFQGDARDVMLFSLCVGPDMPERARQFLRETGNLINVAISRARAICHVFGDLDYAAQCGVPYLETLLARRQQRREVPNVRFDSLRDTYPAACCVLSFVEYPAACCGVVY